MTPRVARASGHKDPIEMTEHTNIGSPQRSWAERVIALDPPMVTGAILATMAIGAILMEVFPIGSLLSWFTFAPVGASEFQRDISLDERPQRGRAFQARQQRGRGAKTTRDIPKPRLLDARLVRARCPAAARRP
jgi:hypothetical protein